MSIVRENLMSRPGYAPFCGGDQCGTALRSKFDGEQFTCYCGWRSSFEPEFMAEYKAYRATWENAKAKS